MDEWARARIETLERRVAELERQAFGGVQAPPGPESDAELQSLIAAGDQLRAIKRYVALTGSDLAGAKAAVERMVASR